MICALWRILVFYQDKESRVFVNKPPSKIKNRRSTRNAAGNRPRNVHPYAMRHFKQELEMCIREEGAPYLSLTLCSEHTLRGLTPPPLGVQVITMLSYRKVFRKQKSGENIEDVK
uniref:Uncharacterized protein n=1 Tax=Cacopsylla melanoneura TaxID=428564 RepID=A0A8D8ZRD6_9HEMI